MDPRADIGNERKYGCIEESQTDPLKDPHRQKGEKRGGDEIGGGGEHKEEGAYGHEGLFGYL